MHRKQNARDTETHVQVAACAGCANSAPNAAVATSLDVSNAVTTGVRALNPGLTVSVASVASVVSVETVPSEAVVPSSHWHSSVEAHPVLDVHVSPAAAAKDAETPMSASTRSARVARGEGDIAEDRGARIGRARVEICRVLNASSLRNARRKSVQHRF